MIDRILADLVLLTHLAFIMFVVFGGLLALRWRWMPWLHLPALAWGAAIELFGGICPLTPLENALRRSSGEAGYHGGFVEHYLVPLIYPAEFDRELGMALGCALLGFNGIVYLAVWWWGRAPR